MRTSAIDQARSCALLLWLLASTQLATAQFVEISVRIEVTSYRAGETNAETVAKPRVISVVCIAGTNNWRIENDFSQNGVNKWFFDGTNVYESLQITGSLPQETQDKMKSAGVIAAFLAEPSSDLTINIWPSSDGHPLGDESVNLAWLAFCSGTYLKREGRLIPLPCENLRHTPDRYAYFDRTETFPDAFGLPRSVELSLSKSLYLSSVEDFYRGWGSRYVGWMKSAVTNLEEGAPTFQYSVTATTNLLSRTFPLRFEFFQKGRDFIQNGNWFRRGVGVVKSIRAAGAPKSVFDPSVNQTIVDWRFYDEATGMNANLYHWTNAFTPQIQDPGLQEKFEARVEQARRHQDAAR